MCHESLPLGPELCTLCGKYYKNIDAHNYKLHSGRMFACNQCDFKTTLNCRLSKHILQVHEGRKQTCDLCGKVVKELKHHKARGCPFGKKKTRHQCTHCDKTFALKDGLNRHVRSVHFQLKDKQCPHCKYKTSEAFNLRLHIARVHEGRKTSAQCPVCDKKVVSLQWHLQQYHKTQDVSAYLNTKEEAEKDNFNQEDQLNFLNKEQANFLNAPEAEGSYLNAPEDKNDFLNPAEEDKDGEEREQLNGPPPLLGPEDPLKLLSAVNVEEDLALGPSHLIYPLPGEI